MGAAEQGVCWIPAGGTPPAGFSGSGGVVAGHRRPWHICIVGVAHQSLDDVDVLAPAHEARGIAVAPPVSKVPTGRSRRGPGLYHQVVQRPRPVTTAEAPVAPWVGEQGRWHRLRGHCRTRSATGQDSRGSPRRRGSPRSCPRRSRTCKSSSTLSRLSSLAVIVLTWSLGHVSVSLSCPWRVSVVLPPHIPLVYWGK